MEVLSVGPSLLAVQPRQRQPIGVVANYSMHHFGAPAVSPDYYN